MAEVLRWLVWLWIAGWLVFPIATRLSPGSCDGGYVLSKLLGLLAAGYAGWLLPALGLARFDASGSAIALLSLALVRFAWRARDTVLPGVAPLKTMLTVEGLFVILFAFGLSQRLHMPELTGLEKFTNLAFLMAARGAETMPPVDAWLAGREINYYYLGHAITALWSRLADVPGDHAYQLMMATIFATTSLATGLAVMELLRRGGRWVASVCAALAALAFAYGGNLHSLLYQAFRDWMPTEKPVFHYPDSTRFIGFDPDVADKGFTEFPAYAFLVGDLHAHVLGTPVFLAVILVLLGVARRAAAGAGVGYGAAAALGWLLGLFAAINPWDLVTAGVPALLLWLALVGRVTADRMATATVIALACAAATAAPFAAAFQSFSDGLRPVDARSPMWQLLVLYGHALPAAAALATLIWVRRGRAGVELLCASGLLLSAIVLLALPELVRMEDIYGDDFSRANTMFKLSFRAQSLILIAGFCAVGFLAQGRTAAFASALVVAAPLVGTLAYVPQTFTPPRAGLTLDGLGFLGAERPLAEALIDAPLAPDEAIIEAAGESFTDTARMSTVSGKPTVLGWRGHEWLWRNNSEILDRRHRDVAVFYTTGSTAERCRIVQRYRLRYAVIGQAERAAHPDLNEEGIVALGPILAQAGDSKIVTLRADECSP
ncbi:DUF2298 domain-containing protein [Psychromarinibacter sp. C21-152]|uniref:DUF2298 domain-containing protein n=1 Tax=Psychromarinibacter sediminicola TaxID=3033385 RepID=A0AAE3TAH4_9RHOB|nr:DUF2298 domain-containing protein [Psychromarinibacter sediminicola]MDF0603262.1 DUF2298 domain-containing protein [Psychromarinibacter sediminicola]